MRVLLALFFLLSFTFPARAQDDAWQELRAVKTQISQGRRWLEDGDAQSKAQLRTAAFHALRLTLKLAGSDILTADKTLPQTGAVGEAMRQAALAHLLWGQATHQFGGAAARDETITAWTRAVQLGGKNSMDVSAAEARYRLAGVLRQGLPLIAPDDVLQTLANRLDENKWTPRRFRFDESTLQFNSGQPATHEFLVTSGQLSPPLLDENHREIETTRVPPFYRVFAPAALPPALQLDRLCLGYARETDGPNRGLWRQIARVYYASPQRTQNRRDDAPRAEALCAQFLKVQALMQSALKLENFHTPERVTTLWLLEVAAEWPSKSPTPARENSWRAAGQTEAAPGEIMFYRMDEPRSEAEWLRQLAHEYGHVILPPFSGFKPPLEPFGNGILGETLGLLWAAQLPVAQVAPPFLATGETLSAQLNGYVAADLLPALRLWNRAGPNSPLRQADNEEGLEYLRGLVLHIERVYGAGVLGTALRTLNKTPEQPLTALAFLDVMPQILNAPLSIWLPGALEFPEQAETASPQQLIEREQSTLTADEAVSAWLCVPQKARTLNIEWQGEAPIIEGDWKFSVAPPSGEKPGVLRIEMNGKSGWQKFAFHVDKAAQITATRFE